MGKVRRNVFVVKVLLTDAQRAAGLMRPDFLTKAELEDLVRRTQKAVFAVVRRNDFGLGDEAESLANLQLYQTGRLFDPAKVTRGRFTRADLASQDPAVRSAIERAFITHVLMPTNTALQRERVPMRLGGMTGVVKDDPFALRLPNELLHNLSADEARTPPIARSV